MILSGFKWTFRIKNQLKSYYDQPVDHDEEVEQPYYKPVINCSDARKPNSAFLQNNEHQRVKQSVH